MGEVSGDTEGAQLERALFDRMCVLDHTERTSYSERGRICLTVKNQMLHRERINPQTGSPCTLTEWVRISAPWSYSTCFASMRDMELLSDIPSEDLIHVPECNFSILKQLSTAVRSQPAVIQAAKSKRSAEFIEHIQRHHADQHVESKETLRFIADATQAAEINKAIELSMERGAMSRTEALLDLSINYRSDVLLEELARTTK